MKLTTEQIKDIYLYISCGHSQRQTAKYTKHTRRTIAHYLKPEIIAGEYMCMNSDHILSQFYKDYEIEKLKIEKKFYKNLSIALGIGFIFQLLISFL